MTRYETLYAGQQVCCTCRHYYQHYIREKKRCSIVYCGHCTFSRPKSRRPDQRCEYWKGKEQDQPQKG